MAEFNIIEYEEQQKKEHLKRLFQDRNFKLEGVTTLLYIASGAIFDSIFSRIWFGALAGLKIPAFKRINERVKSAEKDELIEIIRDSQTYKDLETEYQEYIKDLASLIRIFKFKTAKEIIIYLECLMESGFLSSTQEHKYYIYKNEKDYIPELYGAKVLTGACVCRHMSSFQVNMLNQLGYQAANISCHMTGEDPVKTIEKGKVKLDHSITGVVDNGEKVLYDPTHNLFATIPTGIDMKSEASLFISEYVLPENVHKDNRYLLLSPNLHYANPGNEASCEALNTTRLARITLGEHDYLLEKIGKIHTANIPLELDFFVKHWDQLRTITRLYQELMPYNDAEIKKHIIRR